MLRETLSRLSRKGREDPPHALPLAERSRYLCAKGQVTFPQKVRQPFNGDSQDVHQILDAQARKAEVEALGTAAAEKMHPYSESISQ